MAGIILDDKEHALERIEYIKSLNYTDKEYKKNLRKHMFKYKTRANGILIKRMTAEQELFMFETYGYKNLEKYALDILEQNIQYCNVLEQDTHSKQIEKTIEYMEESNNKEYLLSLKDFATKTAYNWYIPVDRLINWIDCYMIQRDVFFEYASNEQTLLFAPNYFTDSVLLMMVETDNIEEDYEADIDTIVNVYDTLVKGISKILEELPEEQMIENLFTISDEKKEENSKIISQLAKDYYNYIEESSDEEETETGN
ncbi:hypothetical protein PXD04_08850 [Methanosphaera sp. ISO3-F5]|uniref:hypothetical protein n=1 Tax=Methanosphaera sp. ISO3-F5 TaxID=1452353 RepID=UPI002B26283C|nr:hypothetical protein [Methanosphaera sp. ISO3-F5]WQH63798.1 hypothetical protein PXD04_08850 [Methanosphaera sp. ISO3-F5]